MASPNSIGISLLTAIHLKIVCCAGPHGASMESLSPDNLSQIIEGLDPEDLLNLRLVNKVLHEAVRLAQMALKPSSSMQPAQLEKLCIIFPNTTSLYLTSFNSLNNAGLLTLQHLSQSLVVELQLSQCRGWAMRVPLI